MLFVLPNVLLWWTASVMGTRGFSMIWLIGISSVSTAILIDDTWWQRFRMVALVTFIEVMMVIIGTFLMGMVGNSPYLWIRGHIEIDWTRIWDAYVPLVAVITGALGQYEIGYDIIQQRRPIDEIVLE